MLHIKSMRRNSILAIRNFALKAHYSRRSDKNTSSHNVVKSDSNTLDDIDNNAFGTNPNWELLTPEGFRFYLPGSVGPGWSDATTTAHMGTHILDIYDHSNSHNASKANSHHNRNNMEYGLARPTLYCSAQECPMLLRKGIEELFPGCLDVSAPLLTIITVSQKMNLKTRWSKEVETEELAKYFVLAASDICKKLKLVGYWADFINPFSGHPYMGSQKNNTLYKTDERFRCLGFKIEKRRNCKIISYDTDINNFIGNLYTTAPASTEFLQEIINKSYNEL